MLTIDLGTTEYFDPESNSFTYEKKGVVRFEYTLKVLYDWEGKWKKPFLNDNEEFTNEEIIDFYLMMAIDPFDKENLTPDVARKLENYISDHHTATTFRANVEGSSGINKNSNGKVYTSEEIYAVMFGANIPLEFENRNLNRLLVTLKIISSNNAPPKKMSRSDILRQNSKINAERKARHGTKG